MISENLIISITIIVLVIGVVLWDMKSNDE
jgi:hypothetical protein